MNKSAAIGSSLDISPIQSNMHQNNMLQVSASQNISRVASKNKLSMLEHHEKFNGVIKCDLGGDDDDDDGVRSIQHLRTKSNISNNYIANNEEQCDIKIQLHPNIKKTVVDLNTSKRCLSKDSSIAEIAI